VGGVPCDKVMNVDNIFDKFTPAVPLGKRDGLDLYHKIKKVRHHLTDLKIGGVPKGNPHLPVMLYPH